MGTPRWEHCGEIDDATVRPDRLSTFCILEHDFLLGRAMSSLNPSLYRETPCEHNLIESHKQSSDGMWCPGGSREEVTIDYEAATAEVRHLFGRLWFSDEAWTAFTRQIIDVALGE